MRRGSIDKIAFEVGRGWVVRGWAVDLADPEANLQVEILEGADVVAAGPAADFRADLADAAIGKGYHGFSLPLKRQEKGKKARVFSLRSADNSTPLVSPTMFILEQLIGHVDAIEGLFVVGWACDLLDFANKLCVELLIDGEMIERLDADRFRHDLADHGIGSGAYGFRFLIPRSFVDGVRHRIAVRITNTEILLGTTIAVTLKPERLTATLRRLYYQREAILQHMASINEGLLKDGSDLDLRSAILANELELEDIQSLRSVNSGDPSLRSLPKVSAESL